MSMRAPYHDPSQPPKWHALFCPCGCHDERKPVRPCGCCRVGMEGVPAKEVVEVQPDVVAPLTTKVRCWTRGCEDAEHVVLQNKPAVGAKKDWPFGYLPCGCHNNGHGGHFYG